MQVSTGLLLDRPITQTIAATRTQPHTTTRKRPKQPAFVFAQVLFLEICTKIGTL